MAIACISDMCLCGANILWAFSLGVFVTSIAHYALLNMSYQDINKTVKSVPEELKWICCLFATAGAMYAYKTEILALAASFGLTELVMPYFFGSVVLVMLLLRGALGRSSGAPIIPDFLISGYGPLAFMGLVGGYAACEFYVLASKTGEGLYDWVPLILVSVLSGFFSFRGVKFAEGEALLPDSYLKGWFPLAFMLGFGGFSTYQFYAQTTVQGAELTDWIPLVLLVFFSGLLSWWGVAFANEWDFLHIHLTTGKFPVAFFSLVGAYVAYEFLYLASKFGNGLSDWMGLIILSGISGGLSWYGYKMQETA
eukprot:CAMPEP_0117735702 /NCGR_PEP_ID=MMETSP0947-20121206/1473_1 /TAXON_ID=44440 /ORGANISM="Chattonella subsalsa, Strain CCMP2191" /LENGTH=309 /DNA_ID=CAMNT_0005550815 /DNA_START=43 /DNA_END=972 /DNA_ORIENTATION=-